MSACSDFFFIILVANESQSFHFDFWSLSFVALREAEKEEEKRAREKIRQKLEADKVSIHRLCNL